MSKAIWMALLIFPASREIPLSFRWIPSGCKRSLFGIPFTNILGCSVKKMLSTPKNFCLSRTLMIWAEVELFSVSHLGVVKEITTLTRGHFAQIVVTRSKVSFFSNPAQIPLKHSSQLTNKTTLATSFVFIRHVFHCVLYVCLCFHIVGKLAKIN
jgi:hypothetical protein